MKFDKSIIKYILFFLFIVVAHYYTVGQLEITHFEQKTKKGYFATPVKGTIYFTEDSIAAYLYEPMMEYMVLYNPTSQMGFYTGYLPGRRFPVKVWIYENVVFITYRDSRTKLYLKK